MGRVLIHLILLFSPSAPISNRQGLQVQVSRLGFGNRIATSRSSSRKKEGASEENNDMDVWIKIEVDAWDDEGEGGELEATDNEDNEYIEAALTESSCSGAQISRRGWNSRESRTRRRLTTRSRLSSGSLSERLVAFELISHSFHPLLACTISSVSSGSRPIYLFLGLWTKSERTQFAFNLAATFDIPLGL